MTEEQKAAIERHAKCCEMMLESAHQAMEARDLPGVLLYASAAEASSYFAFRFAQS